MCFSLLEGGRVWSFNGWKRRVFSAVFSFSLCRGDRRRRRRKKKRVLSFHLSWSIYRQTSPEQIPQNNVVNLLLSLSHIADTLFACLFDRKFFRKTEVRVWWGEGRGGRGSIFLMTGVVVVVLMMRRREGGLNRWIKNYPLLPPPQIDRWKKKNQLSLKTASTPEK